MPSPTERREQLNELARTTPIPSFYGGDVVELGDASLEGYVSLTTAYHDKENERIKLWNVVKDMLAAGTPYKIVFMGEETWSAASGIKYRPGWELWRSRVGYAHYTNVKDEDAPDDGREE